MNSRNFVCWLIFTTFWCNGNSAEPEFENAQNSRFGDSKYRASRENSKSTYSILSETISKVVKDADSHETCSSDDLSCLEVGSSDKLNLEAIATLHRQLDDDANGNVDLTETNDFLREELKYDSGYERRQKVFHFNDDTHISVKELWDVWLRSEVHNWTVEQTSEWLAACVELPQYVDNFVKHKITGAMLPRLAVNNMQLLTVLGIKDPIHKQKISLKAMDVVLFGPPKAEAQPHWKDLTLIILLVGGSIGLWYAVQQNKKFKSHLNRMNKDMEGLQNAEKTLEHLQSQLEQARHEQESVATEKLNLEKKLQDSSALSNSYSDLEVSQLKAEIEMLRTELQIAEGELKDRCWSPPLGLQQWLQLTHEIENKAYIKKKISAEKQLQHAREACEKLRKKRSSLVGAFVSTHGRSIDDVDRSIVEARTSLNEVTQELQERVHRWRQIEMLCGFNIIVNNGFQHLENTLYRNANLNGRAPLGLRGRMSSQDDLDDDTSSIYTPTTGYMDSGGSHAWKEADSSGSEGSKPEEETTGEVRPNSHNSVHFLVGGEVANMTPEEPSSVIQKHVRMSSQPPSLRSISNNNISSNLVKTGPMIRSYSQEVGPMDITAQHKYSHSESSLEHPMKPKTIINTIKPKTIKEQPCISIEEDICSTDSSVMDDEIKKRKKKLFGFTRKHKSKAE